MKDKFMLDCGHRRIDQCGCHRIAEVGPQGVKGDSGTPGANGDTPFINQDGNWQIGSYDTQIPAQGQNGRDGQDGIQGPQGPQGIPGQDGQDGQDGRDGQDGTNGQDGANGADGQDGISVVAAHTTNGELFLEMSDGTEIDAGDATGPTGPQGLPGAPGPQGPQGPQGDKGDPGTNGQDGAPGPTGPTGPRGNDGAPGPQGLPGNISTLSVVPSTNDTVITWTEAGQQRTTIIPTNASVPPIPTTDGLYRLEVVGGVATWIV